MPTYPPIARLARVQGEVKVEFVLNQSGEPQSITVLSGHPLLRAAAEEFVKSWKFELPRDLYRSEWKYSTTVDFKFSDDESAYENAKLAVVMDSFRYVQIITNPYTGKDAHNCPAKEESLPPAETLSNGDFVKLSRSGCYGTCPAYEVTVSENGEITWNGTSFVQTVGVRHSRIDNEAARTLIEAFRSPKVWELCGGYSASITDSSTTQIELRIGGRSKKVWNYANSAPDWVKTFEDSIDAAANTHFWRHGDPRTEPLSNIFQDSWLPKPGVTSLMQAAARGDINSMKASLSQGIQVDAEDSSGWTALMYAATNEKSDPVQLLLKAGANPNHKSLSGDTPLMASAMAGSFDENLSHAGADINAKNSDGVTALMILAAKGEADEILDALKANADAFAKDSKGRSALEYLHLANCGKSPIREMSFYETGGECDHLDEEDVRKATSALKTATRKRKN